MYVCSQLARQKILPVTKSAHLPIPDPKEMEESDDSHDSTEGVKKFWGKVSKSSKFSFMILLRSSHPIEVVTCIIGYCIINSIFQSNPGEPHCHRSKRHRQESPLLHRHHWHGASQPARLWQACVERTPIKAPSWSCLTVLPSPAPVLLKTWRKCP